MTRDQLELLLRSLIGNEYFAADVDVIHYGSRGEGRDIDLLFIQPIAAATPHFVLGRVDVSVLSRSDFCELALLLDPAATEPILTGDVLIGSRERIGALREKVRAVKAGATIVNHCCRRAIQEYLAADRIWAEAKMRQSSTLLACAFQNLAFSIGYSTFAHYYSREGRGPTTLADLLNSDSIRLPEFWEYRRQIKEGRTVTDADVSDWLDRWSAALALSRR